jgi:hypothetical protein
VHLYNLERACNPAQICHVASLRTFFDVEQRDLGEEEKKKWGTKKYIDQLYNSEI